MDWNEFGSALITEKFELSGTNNNFDIIKDDIESPENDLFGTKQKRVGRPPGIPATDKQKEAVSKAAKAYQAKLR